MLLAFAGIGLHQLTGDPAWDALGSIAIGFLLAFVALILARDNRRLLVGAAGRPDERTRIRDVLDRDDEVDELVELLTLALGPSSLLVAARLDLADRLDSRGVEELCNELDRRIREAVPHVTEVFLGETVGPRRARHHLSRPAS